MTTVESAALAAAASLAAVVAAWQDCGVSGGIFCPSGVQYKEVSMVIEIEK